MHTAADVDMLRICVSAEKLRDRLNDDDVLDVERPLWPLLPLIQSNVAMKALN